MIGDEINAGEEVGRVDTIDDEDVQPQQVLNTPELPSREIIQSLPRIPPGLGYEVYVVCYVL